ncbi:DUF3137 domain-containing protein [uncultured Parvibaculum sp.]|uniref:DUF3137 domain-containing protein n=1 Tax=uncultured Parvibaculum sp. TaxID=291828 RepID=UPI000C89C0EE|nr:hypothetical protein [Parvibaculum sp.]
MRREMLDAVADERARAFDGFLTAELEPWLAVKEGERAKIAQRSYILAGAAILFAIAMALALSTSTEIQFALFAGGFIGIAGTGLALWPLSSWGKTFKADLFSRIFRWFGYEYSPDAPVTLMEPLRRCGILPGYDKRHLEDHVWGEIDRARFELADCKLVEEHRDSKGRTSETTVFHGLIGYFTFAKPFQGRTVLHTDHGTIFNALGGMGRDGERVVLEDPKFENVFEVYSTDQVEARYLLTPAFMERLLAMRDRLGGRMQAAFLDEKLYLSVHLGKDHFRNPSVFTRVDDPQKVERLVAPILFIASAVRILKLNQETRV